MRRLTIGKVAKLAGVGVETIRFYERKGLISRPPRGISGYREYSLETISRIRFIKRAQAVGFSLKEIKELLELREAPETNCQDIRQRTWSKIQEIEEKIARLQ
ncbi:MerR family transcriptional regulator [Thermosulfuriphilus sp.]